MESSGFFELTRSQSMSPMARLPRYYVGVDLGQSRDPTATAVVPVLTRRSPSPMTISA